MNRFFTEAVLFSSFLMIIGLSGCATLDPSSDKGFSYTSIPVATGTVSSGEGSSIQFRGAPLDLSGQSIAQGDSLRSVKVAKDDLSLLDIASTKGKVRIISVVPSLDTKVCEQQTHYLSEKNQGLDAQVDLYTISVDTPFAQGRFAKEAKINNVTFLSDYRGGDFGRTFGLLLEGPHVLARTVMVVDQHNVIKYLQVTPDLANMPDMEAAFEAARKLL
ncbi:thiol peroxidase [Candidatus Nitronereus thalassa]|uniref:Thiol peroxidase n=1 Tax=Candidatus Nitronereus thalassa TaxID=3020898 RepID=A0ABU3K3W4_9BACT|nr:thiol peroxidase [Candidatus Nitronereus thalassa]MDT7041080.1 thiol peroxidase [Candidatus Nitronereus thalassa]